MGPMFLIALLGGGGYVYFKGREQARLDRISAEMQRKYAALDAAATDASVWLYFKPGAPAKKYLSRIMGAIRTRASGSAPYLKSMTRGDTFMMNMRVPRGQLKAFPLPGQSFRIKFIVNQGSRGKAGLTFNPIVQSVTMIRPKPEGI